MVNPCGCCNDFECCPGCPECELGFFEGEEAHGDVAQLAEQGIGRPTIDPRVQVQALPSPRCTARQ